VQTYSDGTEAAWIEPTVDGQEPEHPAPTLSLTAAGDAAPDATDTAPEPADSSGTAVVALVVAIVALVVALAGGVLGWRASRRTVSS
jgi:hypothetical protein